MSFPSKDKYWLNTLEFLQKHILNGDKVIAPKEFQAKLPGIISYSYVFSNENIEYKWLIIHKGRLEELNKNLLAGINEYSFPVFANEVFVVFLKYNYIDIEKIDEQSHHIQALNNRLKEFYQNRHQKNNYPLQSEINIQNLQILSREEIENICRQNCKTSYIGNKTIICNVLSKYIFYCDAEDVGIVPHLALKGCWEAWITIAMARILRKGWHCIDIGANHGYYSILMADAVGSYGHVLAIEPNPQLTTLLEKTKQVNGFEQQIMILQKAISDVQAQKVKLVIPDGRGINATICKEGVLTDRIIEVETIAIDNLTRDWAKVDFIKIDAEGGEENIWRGMHETLIKNKNITVMMEFNCSRYLEPSKFLQNIQSFGFPLRYIDYDSQIKKITVEQCLTERPQEDWMLFLQRQ